MNNFMNYIQPSIVKFSSDEELPESIQNHYMINYNIVGIKYFLENFMISETSGHNIVLKEVYKEGDPVDGFAWLTEESLSEEDVIDIPRLYIVITESLVQNDDKLRQFIMGGLIDNSVYGDGIDGFVPGVDYYMNETMYKYLVKMDLIEENEDLLLPNHLNKNGELTEYFDELDCNEKDYNNLAYYYNKNKLADNEYSEDELNNFYSTFASTILNNSTIDDETKNTQKNQVYETVLEYYANNQSDGTSTILQLILGSNFGSSSIINNGCGCASGSSCSGANSSEPNTTSCYDLYTSALAEYLKTMLGDPEFYEDWFTTNMGGGAGPGGAGNGVTIPNDTLIDALKNLIDEFVELGYDLNFTGKRGANTLCGCRHMTPAGSLSGALNGGGNNGTNPAYPGTGDSPQNYKTLENYEKVLDWIKNCEMDANRNKINVYGKAFGELLPKLQF